MLWAKDYKEKIYLSPKKELNPRRSINWQGALTHWATGSRMVARSFAVLHTTTINNVKSALRVDKYNDGKSYFVIAIVISFPVLTSPPTYALLMLDSGVFSSDLGSREYSISTSSKQHNLDVTWDSKLGSDG